MHKCFWLFVIAIIFSCCGSVVCFAQSTVLIHNFTNNAIIPLPSGSCLIVDELIGSSTYTDAKLCDNWAAAFGALTASNNLSDIPSPASAWSNLGGGPLGKLGFPASSALLGSNGSGFTNITIGANLSLISGVLSATGGGGGGATPSGANNSIQYNSSNLLAGTNVLGNAVLITGSNGVPQEATTLPAGLVIPGYLSGLTLTGVVTGSGGPSITTAFAGANDSTLLSNISGSPAAPIYNTLTATLDHVFGAVQGSVLCRTASSWAAVLPGVVGQFLQTQGSGANCQWATPTGGGNAVGTGTAVVNAVPRVTGAYTMDFTGYSVGQTGNSVLVQTTPTGTINPSLISGSISLPGYISGLIISNDGTTPNTIIDITSGLATSDDTTTAMRLASNYTKTTAAWALGTGLGCLDTGAVTPTSWYYVYEIERTDTLVVDLLCTKTFNAPTFPASYTKKRLIAEFATDGSSNIRRFYSHQNGQLYKWLAGTYQTSVATTSRTLVTLDVPPNLIVVPLCAVSVSNAAPPVSVLIQSPADTDASPDVNSPFVATPGWDVYAQVSQQGGPSNSTCPAGLETNTAQQIATHASLAATTANFISKGWLQVR